MSVCVLSADADLMMAAKQVLSQARPGRVLECSVAGDLERLSFTDQTPTGSVHEALVRVRRRLTANGEYTMVLTTALT